MAGVSWLERDVGAEDLIAAAQYFDKKCKSIEKIALLGVSMGGNMSGLAVALTGAKDIKNSNGDPLFDYWLDIEGAVNMTETYLSARALAPANATAAAAAEDIEAETGGPIESNPGAYQERTVVARIEDIDAAGLKGVVVVHGVDDGLVPYNQAREMASLLAQKQIPTELVTIGEKSEESERDTSASGYAMSNVDPDYRSPLAGHASEKSTTHIVMVTAFDYLWSVL
ncbi:MAG TPA: prolyl oligopeptidase family serine peptidase, partial [Actinomycetota bacterium]|nr:prolyl oligopeptidase family serine peptidase [Actinomycetota bacterium]